MGEEGEAGFGSRRRRVGKENSFDSGAIGERDVDRREAELVENSGHVEERFARAPFMDDV
jgi:hypothetical protein